MRKPTPEELQRLREAMPKGSPRIEYREMTLLVEPRTADAAAEPDDAPLPITMSSEHPVLRWDWWVDERYYEVLDHSPESIDLSYARDGLPFIMSHRAYDGDQQHGLAENVRADDRKLKAAVRFSRAQRSQEIAQDMRDGIRRKVSIGYIVGDEYEQTEKRNGIPVRRYKSWMPIEVSTVPVPADYEVGIGRARSVDGQDALTRFLSLHPAAPCTSTTDTTEDRTMDNTNGAGGAAAPATPDIRVIEREANERAATRVKDVTDLATQHGCSDKLEGWLRDGKSADEVTREINTVLSARMKNQATAGVGADGAMNETRWRSGFLEVDRKTADRFSFARALLLCDPSQAQQQLGRNVDFGVEMELIQEAKKRTPFSANERGHLIPFVTSRANVDSATSTTGGPFKFTQPGDFIDLLRNATSVMRAGATVIPGLTGPVTFPKQTGAATAAWVAENPGSDMSRSNLTTSTVSLAFKTVQAATAVSRQALFSAASGNYDLELIIRNDLAKVIALAIDLGGLNGSNSNNQPLGILQDTNVGAGTTLGTNGGTIAWTNIVDLEYVPGNANASGSRWAYVTNAKQRKQAKLIAPLGATNFGVPVWTEGRAEFPDGGRGLPSMDGVVNGYPAFMSNQVPSNLTKGTATTVCSAWVFGAFEHLLIGMFGAGFEVLVDPYTLKLQNMIDLTAWNFVDVANRYPAAFATLKDAL